MTNPNAEEIKQAVLEHYSRRAKERMGGEEPKSCCCSGGARQTDCCSTSKPGLEEAELAERLYSDEELASVPAEVAAATLGCGNPTALASMKPGEWVLDLGSGAGLDCFLSAKKVGPQGHVVGLDMNPDMLSLAWANVSKLGVRNVEFRAGEMEAMPFAANQFDVIISNCVINLSPDKPAVFREALRVLKPGGRICVSDVVWLREPSAEERGDLAKWAGCIAGALQKDQYARELASAGFDGVSIELTDVIEEQPWASAIITAKKPWA